MMDLIQNTNHFLCGVLDSSLLHSVGFIGFVCGNIAYYKLFHRHPWMYKYVTFLPSVVSIGSMFYLHKHYIPGTSVTVSYVLGALVPHILFMRDVDIIREFTK
jgi:hypothetical protein